MTFVLKFLWATSPRWHVVNLFFLIIQSVLPLVNIYQIKLIFDTVTKYTKSGEYTEAVSLLTWQVSFTVGLLIVNSLINSIAGLVKTKHNQIISEAILEELHKKSSTIDYQYFENPEYHDTFYRIQSDGHGRIFSTFNQLQSIFQSFISLAALFSMLAVLHWSTSIIIVSSVLPALLSQYKFSKLRHQWYQKRTSLHREGAYYNWMLTANQPAKEIRTYGLGELFIHRAKKIRELLFDENYLLTLKSTYWNFGAKLVELLAIYSIFLFLIIRSLNGSFSVGDLVMYYQIFSRGQSNVNGLLSGFVNLSTDNLFFKYLIEYLSYNSSGKRLPDSEPFPDHITDIELRNVYFKYPNQDNYILKDISLYIKRGQKVAIVGKNGSGKTSMIKLFNKLYEPTTGTICINGIDYTNFDTHTLQNKVNILFQDYMNYYIKAGENISFGDIDNINNHIRLTKVAQCTGASEFIEGFPHQYDATLGKLFDSGQELSAGQWQKVALARALMRDAPIVILDEPSSSMDTIAENNLVDRISNLIKDKIVILISHRLSTVKLADCIYFIENGSIVEKGTHETLMGLQGSYYEMFNLQSNGANVLY
ncbi:ABC transporter ATP-binding protein [Spirosoma sp. KNUC1025]|uniref:ABC transporter ATP-binding protein n=1 Tax=Spirosoma sp. KNUC1025 TaxID=2894082 RepID=UPI0038701660|nr:ABC transporter ATP-binding protein/permease [Spirosoma sp. KNUC1025]